MPNYVKHRISVDKCFTEVSEAVSGENGVVDFNEIIPMPEEIQKSRHGGMVCYWGRENWGTKWNAVDAEILNGDFVFSTAWASPTPVIDAISQKFPDVTFTVRYADEDYGTNCAHYKIKDGLKEGFYELGMEEVVQLWGYNSLADYEEEMKKWEGDSDGHCEATIAEKIEAAFATHESPSKSIIMAFAEMGDLVQKSCVKDASTEFLLSDDLRVNVFYSQSFYSVYVRNSCSMKEEKHDWKVNIWSSEKIDIECPLQFAEDMRSASHDIIRVFTLLATHLTEEGCSQLRKKLIERKKAAEDELSIVEEELKSIS